jgi:hypothetical protein
MGGPKSSSFGIKSKSPREYPDVSSFILELDRVDCPEGALSSREPRSYFYEKVFAFDFEQVKQSYKLAQRNERPNHCKWRQKINIVFP